MNDQYSKVAAVAVGAALRLARSEMPEASDARLLLMILGNAAACCGRLRVEYPDVLGIVSGLYSGGFRIAPASRPHAEVQHRRLRWRSLRFGMNKWRSLLPDLLPNSVARGADGCR